MPIRIMHVVNNLGKGGLENGLVNLIERLDPARFEHVVCTVRGLGPNAERLPLDRVQVRSLGDANSSSRFQTPALVRAIRHYEPAIVHSRNWGSIEAVIAARLARNCGVVHSEHGLETAAGANEPRRRTYFRRLAYELADRVLSVSRQLRDLHANRTGFAASRIAVIHNGVDRNRFFPHLETRGRVRAELGLHDTELCIGCVANLLPVKDHITLLEALNRVAASTRDLHVLLIGEGPERERLAAFIDSSPALKGRASLLGSSSLVPDLLRAMDVFVLPSVAEGICNSLLEAMATGLPVIATAVGGNPEVVVDGESGLLFPPRDVSTLANHLARLQSQPGLRLRLGQSAIQRVRDEFSIESMVRAYEHLYTIVRQRQAGAPVLSAG